MTTRSDTDWLLREALTILDKGATLPPRPTQYRRGFARGQEVAAAFIRRALSATPPDTDPSHSWPSLDELRQMTPAEVNRFLASRGVSIRVRDDGEGDPSGPNAAWEALREDIAFKGASASSHMGEVASEVITARHRPIIEEAIRAECEAMTEALEADHHRVQDGVLAKDWNGRLDVERLTRAMWHTGWSWLAWVDDIDPADIKGTKRKATALRNTAHRLAAAYAKETGS